jgi:hypothetical protein
MTSTLPAVFLSIATILNTNKWIYFNFKIEAMKAPYSEDNESKLDFRRVVINVGTVIVCLGILAVPIFYYTEGCSPKYQRPE